MMKRMTLFLAVAAVAVLMARTSAMIPEQVKVDTGLLEGVTSGTQSSVRIFKGIPFAAAPVGENRWRAPQPAAKWDGVRKADAFGAPCTSGPANFGRGGPGRGARGGDRGAAPAAAPAPAAPPREPARSEDCLYLNVWTSAKSAGDKRPVMVWIYGGGFTGGSGGMAWYDGENLASKGPVIVTLNYRLGSLGFLATPELAKESGHNASGNYGVMDALAALQWVKRNIAAFGGDPNNVTVAGESAGAIMVGALVGAPQAKGLFKRAIAESGGWMGLTQAHMRTAADAQAAGAKSVEALGVKTLAELRAKPLDELTGLNSAGLIVDGYVIPEDSSLTFANGKENAVDVITGSNKDEANFGICGPGVGLAGRGGAPMTVATFKANAERKYGELAPEFLKLYPAATDADAAKMAHEACGDEVNWNMRQWAAAQAKQGKKAYVYFFPHVQMVVTPQDREHAVPSAAGATHTAEISFAWNNPKGQATQMWNDADTKLADQMSSYWMNFVTSGDPNGKGLPEWPRFKDMSSKVMVLDNEPRADTVVSAPKLAFYSAAFQRLMKSSPVAN